MYRLFARAASLSVQSGDANWFRARHQFAFAL
jgi:hypothetical protein